MEKLSHAYIYTGQRGLGKYKSALALAKRLTGGNIADIIDVSNERYGIKANLSGTVSVQAVREARKDAYVRPYSDKKVIIINHADSLNAEGQNALLKVLEEPPEYCVFILIAENDNKLLPTIKSRAVIKRFHPLSNKQMQESIGTTTKAKIATEITGGSLERARELMENEDLEEIYNNTLDILCGLAGSSRNLYKAIAYFETNKDKRELLFDITSAVCRKRLLCNEQNCDTIKFDIPQKACVDFIEDLERMRIRLKQNGNYTMLITAWLMRGYESFGRKL